MLTVVVSLMIWLLTLPDPTRRGSCHAVTVYNGMQLLALEIKLPNQASCVVPFCGEISAVGFCSRLPCAPQASQSRMLQRSEVYPGPNKKCGECGVCGSWPPLRCGIFGDSLGPMRFSERLDAILQGWRLADTAFWSSCSNYRFP